MAKRIWQFITSPYMMLAFAILTWAGNFVLGRSIRVEVTPISLTFWRWFTAFLLMLPFYGKYFASHGAAMRRHALWLVVMSVLGVGLFHVFVYQALQTTEAINASLMLAATPVVILVIVWVGFGERLLPRQVLGIFISLGGVASVVTRGDLSIILELEFTPGDLWMLGAVPLWALYSVMLRHRPSELPPFAFLVAITGIGSVLLGAAYAWEASQGRGMVFSTGNLISVLYLGVFASFLAYIFWNEGIARIGASKGGQFMHLMPVFSTILAVIFLGEQVHLYHVAGIALIFAGIYLNSSTKNA